MDIAFVSACFGDLDMEEYWDHVYPTVDQYCKKFGFDFHLYEKQLDGNRAPQWSKIPAVRRHINEYDWIVWIDADIMIMNHTIDIREYIDASYNFIITKLHQPIAEYDLNTGLCFFKGKREWSKEFLYRVYYGDNKFVKNPYDFYHEQSSTGAAVEKDKFIENNVLVRDPQIHKFWPHKLPETKDLLLHPKDGLVKNWSGRLKRGVYFKRGDFCVHFLGMPYDERANLYELFSDHVILHH